MHPTDSADLSPQEGEGSNTDVALNSMQTADEDVASLGGGLRCKAHARTGARCANPAVRGASVCRMHGGVAPQVKARRKGHLRMLELVSPAVTTLAREMATATRSADRIRAAENILDRAGLPRQVDNMDTDVARQLLLSRLLQMRQPEEMTVIEAESKE